MNARGSLFDAPVAPPIKAASAWVSGTLSGTLVTGVAVLAVALLGLALLHGRLLVREAVQAVLGCFVLFGAAAIAAGLLGGVSDEPEAVASAPIADLPYQPEVPPPPPPAQYDPYAGATVRQDRR